MNHLHRIRNEIEVRF